MCIGIPLQIIETSDTIAQCRGRYGEQAVNMMLIGRQPVGTWVLSFLDSAREVISEEDAQQINSALDCLSAISRGDGDVDIDSYFTDMPLSTMTES